jgi:hypothetical protein
MASHSPRLGSETRGSRFSHLETEQDTLTIGKVAVIHIPHCQDQRSISCLEQYSATHPFIAPGNRLGLAKGILLACLMSLLIWSVILVSYLARRS